MLLFLKPCFCLINIFHPLIFFRQLRNFSSDSWMVSVLRFFLLVCGLLGQSCCRHSPQIWCSVVIASLHLRQTLKFRYGKFCAGEWVCWLVNFTSGWSPGEHSIKEPLNVSICRPVLKTSKKEGWEYHHSDFHFVPVFSISAPLTLLSACPWIQGLTE